MRKLTDADKPQDVENASDKICQLHKAKAATTGRLSTASGLTDEEHIVDRQQPLRQQRRAATRSMALIAIGGITLTVAMSVTSILLTRQHVDSLQVPLLANKPANTIQDTSAIIIR